MNATLSSEYGSITVIYTNIAVAWHLEYSCLMFTDFFFCQILLYVLSASPMNYYSQHHHRLFLLLLLLILTSTLTFCCFSLICIDWIEVTRLLPAKPSGINLSTLPRLLTNISTPFPLKLASLLSPSLWSWHLKRHPLQSALDTTLKIITLLAYWTRWQSLHPPQSLLSTTWNKCFWPLLQGLSELISLYCF